MPGRRPSRPIVDPARPAGATRPVRPAHEAGYVVRASELGSYAYCERAWWLRYVAGLQPDAPGQARLDGGTSHHAAHGRGVWLAGILWRLSLVGVALAGLGALFWLLAALLAQ